MVRSLRFALCIFIALAAATVGVRSVVACDLCRQMHTTAFHIEGLNGETTSDGGDSSRDAINENNLGSNGGGGAWLGQKWPQPEGPGSPVYLTYSYENLLDGMLLMPNGQPLSPTIIKKSIDQAFRVWARYAPLHFREVEDNGLPYGNPAATFGDIRFRVYEGESEPTPGPGQTEEDVAQTKARAYYPTGGLLSGDVEYDIFDRWQLIGTIPQPDVLGAAIHEIGHSLGLIHTGVRQANMYRIFTRYSGLDQGDLFPDDIASIHEVYGAGYGSVTPLTPEPASWMLLAGSLLGAWARRRPKR